MATQNKLIYPLPTQQTTDSINENNILWDLGKPTKRGTKKCPDCGFLNGTRCYICKNPVCNRILKATDKHKVHIDAIKLLTGMARKIYSVRVREKGSPDPDQRGFVQLPCVFYERDRLNEVALCFVNNCERSYSILKCHENEDDEEDDAIAGDNALSLCVHIESAAKSLSVAHAIEFKHDLINNLKAGDDVKKMLCSLAKSTEGPLVQRIAKSVMAIKCFANSTNPLGYLHFILEYKRGENCTDEEVERFQCECNNGGIKCLHYYACVCAFASDPKLMPKNASFVQHEFDREIGYDFNKLLDESRDNYYPLENIRIEILQPELLGIPQLSNKNKKLQKSARKRQKHEENAKVEESSQQNDAGIVKVMANDLIRSVVDAGTICTGNNVLETNFGYDVLGFQEWFISVVERINETCTIPQNSHDFFDVFCQQNGVTDIQEVRLTFHVPDRFIELFKELLYSHMRNYQPHHCSMHSTSGNDADAYGSMQFTISDITQLEQLFTTPVIKLSCYQLLVSEQWPFRIMWSSNLYKLSKFGELQLIFAKQIHST